MGYRRGSSDELHRLESKVRERYKPETELLHKTLQEVGAEKEQILNPPELRTVRAVGNYSGMVLLGAGVVAYFAFGPVVVLLALPMLLLLLGISNATDAVSKRIEKRIQQGQRLKLEELNSKTQQASARLSRVFLESQGAIRAERDRQWLHHPTYPPDWDQRRAEVLESDGYACTSCGWPEGFRRKARELHVHHVTPLSEGGDHSASNLTTLCHICHRGIDSRHNRVRRTSAGKRRRRRSP